MTEFIEITGNGELKGEVRVRGAKNAVLPMLIASLLTEEKVVYHNVPRLSDVHVVLSLLEHFGSETQYLNDSITLSTPDILSTEASYSLVKAMRASFWVLAPVLVRGGSAKVALPGGDLIGARPVDLHIEALRAMGAEIKVSHGVVHAVAENGLHPAKIKLRFPSVGATHQILLAASLTEGETQIEGAAREPEVVALANLLSSMGAEIEGAGEGKVIIRGKSKLHGAEVSLIGDRIEASSYILAAAVTKGDVKVNGFNPKHLGEFLPILKEMGIPMEIGDDFIHVKRCESIKPVTVRTEPFPGFATDIQAPLMAALCLADGESSIEETIFEGRFGHVSELCRMGASITVDQRIAKIKGVKQLSGAIVEAGDIRAGAALVIAGLVAEGKTQILEPQHIRRGYSLSLIHI